MDLRIRMLVTAVIMVIMAEDTTAVITVRYSGIGY